MALPLTPTTELEAVNTMLSTIGESPVNSLGVTGVVDAVTAKTILGSVNRDVQSDSWSFNTDKAFPLLVEAFAPFYILVPSTALQVDAAGNDKGLDVVVRGTKLYDRTTHTYSFTDRTKVECDITWLLPFDELPEAARRYITIRAARIFQDRVVGSDLLHSFNAQDEQSARWRLKKHENKTADRNFLTGNYSVGRIIDRRPR